MLNELCQLADSLDLAGISPKEWHPQLKQLPKANDKKPCYKISIDKDGCIAGIDAIPNDLVPLLRKWEPSNGSSFPGFNFQPLFRITDDAQKKKLKEWKDGKSPVDEEVFKACCSDQNRNWDLKFFTKIKKCLNDIPKSLSVFLKNENETDSLKVLISRVIRLPYSEEESNQIENAFKKGLGHALEEYLWNTISSGKATKDVLSVLIHEGILENDPQNDRGTNSVFFDIPDWKEYPVASKASLNALNMALISGTAKESSIKEFDAFGESIIGGDHKLPGVKLPILAEVKLRAMNSESSCQCRYGTIDSESFPIGQNSRKRAKGALEWLADPLHEGETWGRADSKELIFAYPSILPKVSLKLAACFGALKVDNSEARFADAAKDVIAGLSGISNDLRSFELRVFALKKMDKARTKVVFYRNYSAQRLVDAASDWQKGCANVPEIKVRAWGDKKGEGIFPEMLTPFPLQIAPCLNRVWKLDGSTECEAPLIARSQGIELLLDEHSERFIPHLLSVVLQNAKGLMLSVGNDLNQGNIISIKGYDKHKLLIPSILGLLLHKLGIRKESYMSNAPFLVGKMLKLADELHALYCKEVRDNKLPPQLIGNSLMTAALDSPTQSLAQLALRLKPYYGWAQTYRSKENGGLAGYFINLYGDTASDLAKLTLPTRFNDAERAQLLLGYLAAHPKKSEKTNEQQL